MGTKSKRSLAIISAIFTTILWGLSFLSIKTSVKVVPPMTLGFSRFLIASLVLFIATKLMKTDVSVNKRDLPYLALAGLIGITLYFAFENNGVKILPASSASLITATVPIATLILESIFFKTKLSKVKIISIILSFIGVLLIVDIDFKNLSSVASHDYTKGYILMFGAVGCWVIYTLSTKKLYEKYSQLAVVFYQQLFGTIFFIPFIFFEKTNLSNIDGVIVLNILYLGVICSALGYCTYVYALGQLGASSTSLFINIIPLVAVVASFFILKESINITQVLGGVLIILSVYFVSFFEKEEKSLSTE